MFQEKMKQAINNQNCTISIKTKHLKIGKNANAKIKISFQNKKWKMQKLIAIYNILNGISYFFL